MRVCVVLRILSLVLPMGADNKLSFLHQLASVTSLSSPFTVDAGSMCLGGGVGSLAVQFGVPSSISGHHSRFSSPGVCLPSSSSSFVSTPPSVPGAQLAPPVTSVLPPVSSASFVC